MKFLFFPLTFILSILLSSCIYREEPCTMMACIYESQRMSIKFDEKYYSTDLDAMKIYLLDTASHKIVDSMDRNSYQMDGYIPSERRLFFPYFTQNINGRYVPNQFDYLIKIKKNLDTLKKVDFKLNTIKYKCNDCKSEPYTVQTLVTEITYQHKGKLFTANNPSILIK